MQDIPNLFDPPDGHPGADVLRPSDPYDAIGGRPTRPKRWPRKSEQEAVPPHIRAWKRRVQPVADDGVIDLAEYRTRRDRAA